MNTKRTFLSALFALLLMGLAPSCANNRAADAPDEQADSTRRVTLLFAGDLMQHQPQLDDARRPDGTYDYEACFAAVKEQVSAADIAVANLEVTLGGAPYKGYPCFSAPDTYAAAAKAAGFDVLQTANNHSVDRGRKGIERTIDVLDSLGIPHYGTYKNAAERERQTPLIVEKNGIRIALLAYTYGTNGLRVPAPNIVNPIDRELIAKDIAKAKAAKPDALIACIHWGVEYALMPNSEQRELADWLFEQGVDHIIGGHPHVVQPMELRTAPDSSRHFLAYSLGNFVSNQSKPNTDGGLMVTLTLEKDSVTRLADCSYSLQWVSRPAVSGKKGYRILPVNTPQEQLNARERSLMNTFVTNARNLFRRENKGELRETTAP